jgi:hypothetical protein
MTVSSGVKRVLSVLLFLLGAAITIAASFPAAYQAAMSHHHYPHTWTTRIRVFPKVMTNGRLVSNDKRACRQPSLAGDNHVYRELRKAAVWLRG